MKEFDHPHVTKLIGKLVLLLAPQSTSRSCALPHSLPYSALLPSGSGVEQPPPCCLRSHMSPSLLPRPTGRWSVCRGSQHLPSYTGDKHLLFKPFLWSLQMLRAEFGWLRYV